MLIVIFHLNEYSKTLSQELSAIFKVEIEVEKQRHEEKDVRTQNPNLKIQKEP